MRPTYPPHGLSPRESSTSDAGSWAVDREGTVLVNPVDSTNDTGTGVLSPGFQWVIGQRERRPAR
jgi:hypothetical protein